MKKIAWAKVVDGYDNEVPHGPIILETQEKIVLTLEITSEEAEIEISLNSGVEDILIDWGDGMISDANDESSYKYIHYYNEGTYTVNVYGKDIHYFDCRNCKVSALDVSKCSQLKTLECDGNYLSQLDFSKCTELTALYCANNRLTELDITQCTQLRTLNCEGNQLTELDVSQCVNINSLRCGSNSFDGDAMTAIYKDLPIADEPILFDSGSIDRYRSVLTLTKMDAKGKTAILKNKRWGLIIE